ncbi:MAG TPA: methyltransferase [Bauldia sp.]|nr:methyltransferase [Bauldia sp.]
MPAPAVTTDAFLGGRVVAVQPGKDHHRSGLEAVLLGSSVPSDFAGSIVDLGAGSGVAGFCAAKRCGGASVLLVERETELVEAARASLALPANAGIAPRVRVLAADLAETSALRSEEGRADLVIANPPFNPSRSMAPSPKGGRAAAHAIRAGGLENWVQAANRLLKAGGRVTFILRPDNLPELLASLGVAFGTIDLLPLHPRPGEAAHRLLVTALKAGRAPLRLLPALCLHGETGNAYLPAIEAILREGAALTSAAPAWQGRR